MATARVLPLTTVEQYLELPDPPGYIQELHFGEVVKVEIPRRARYDVQRRIRDLLEKALGKKRWVIGIGLPYGLAPGFDVRGADVGVALKARWDAAPDSGYMIGSPYLVIQVKSRSNRDRKDEENAILHVTHGANAVWLVKPERREVVVITSTSRTVYAAADPLPLPNGKSLPVSEIF